MLRCKRSGIRVAAKVWFFILFDFFTLPAQTALLAICICFCLFCSVQISNGDRGMEHRVVTVLFHEFLDVE